MSHHIRPRSNGRAFELRIKHKLLPKPVYMTCYSEEEAAKQAKRYEDALARGVVPIELLPKQRAPFTDIAGAISAYENAKAVPRSTERVLETVTRDIGQTRLQVLNYTWAEDWVLQQKIKHNRAPGTIRHHVGALSRCLTWVTKKHPECLAANPLADLDRGYSTYNKEEAQILREKGLDSKEDLERDRRLAPEEEERILKILDEWIEREQDPDLKAQHRAARLMFLLALETAMRMRELYTLTVDLAQINLERRTIFLTKTKNGDRREVPLSSVALRLLSEAIPQPWTERNGRLLFPFWDGDRSDAALERTTTAVSKYFAELFDAAGCADLTFHDARHEATCRLVLRTALLGTPLDQVQISRITGHKDPRILRRYMSLRGSELAQYLW